jgi:carbamate kinase
MGKSILIAVGGNSLIRSGEKGTAAEQMHNAQRTARAIVGLVRAGHRLVITHGNGPQVGADLLRSERAVDQVPGLPLDLCDAATQGEIGYVLQQSLYNELKAAGLQVPVVTVLTQSLVSPDDVAMQHPTKPIGPFYSDHEAQARSCELGWEMVEDAARGYRRVVPSPVPISIVESGVIRSLVADGVLVIAAGGGGIPVMSSGGRLQGIEAVIDKDRASAMLATELGMDVFAISTDVSCVYLNYKKPGQRPLSRVTASEMQSYLEAGEFPPGNMGPKIESALQFLWAGGSEVIITSYDHLCEAIAGPGGTRIVPDTLEERKLGEELAQALGEAFRP